MAILQGSNRALPNEAASFVDQFEELEKKVLSITSEMMTKVKKVREEQKELLDDAKSKGWAKGVIKDTVKIRKKFREIEELMRAQEDDAKDDVDKLLKALGGLSDLPLGVAAVQAVETPKAKAEKQDQARTAAVVSAVKDSMTDEEIEKNTKPAAMTDEEWEAANPRGASKH